MSVWGISLVKDELDVIAATVTHMLAEVDHVLIADNGSTDGTREILEGLDVTVLDDPNVAHYQARKLTALAAAASDRGAEWVVPFDADEIVYSLHGRIADVLRKARRTWIFTAQLYEHVVTAQDPGGHPFRSMEFRRRNLNPLLKVACRCHPDLLIGEGSHTCDYAGEYPRTEPGLAIRHFPYRSPEQFVSKVRNGYAGRSATDLPEDVSPHLRAYGRLLEEEGPEALFEVFRREMRWEDPASDPGLVYDPCPVGLPR